MVGLVVEHVGGEYPVGDGAGLLVNAAGVSDRRSEPVGLEGGGPVEDAAIDGDAVLPEFRKVRIEIDAEVGQGDGITSKAGEKN